MKTRIVGTVAAAFLLVATTALVAVAVTGPNAGPFTGCLAQKTVAGTPAVKGQIYNVAISATTPLAPCVRGDAAITFSNAQGPKGDKGDPGPSGAPGEGGGGSLAGTVCDAGNLGDGHLSFKVEGALDYSTDVRRHGISADLVCLPDNWRWVQITYQGAAVEITPTPDPLWGLVCDPQHSESCYAWLPLGQPVTIAFEPDASNVLGFAFWSIPGCPASSTATSCTFTVSGDGQVAISFVNP